MPAAASTAITSASGAISTIFRAAHPLPHPRSTALMAAGAPSSALSRYSLQGPSFDTSITTSLPSTAHPLKSATVALSRASSGCARGAAATSSICSADDLLTTLTLGATDRRSNPRLALPWPGTSLHSSSMVIAGSRWGVSALRASSFSFRSAASAWASSRFFSFSRSSSSSAGTPLLSFTSSLSPSSSLMGTVAPHSLR
mmetsp:Transcript_12904/g.32498  ORF Transcript_12904/g.32498 Transcript_12904/m.32498 type:complete len:200 (-) Transcript_12904:834-1433(-)